MAGRTDNFSPPVGRSRERQKGRIRPVASKASGPRRADDGQAELAGLGQQRLGDFQLLQMQGVRDSHQAQLIEGRLADGQLDGLAVGLQDQRQPPPRPRVGW